MCSWIWVSLLRSNKVSHHCRAANSSALNFHFRGPKVAEQPPSLFPKEKKKRKKATKQGGNTNSNPSLCSSPLLLLLHLLQNSKTKISPFSKPVAFKAPSPPILLSHFKWRNFPSLRKIFVWVFGLRRLPWISTTNPPFLKLPVTLRPAATLSLTAEPAPTPPPSPTPPPTTVVSALSPLRPFSPDRAPESLNSPSEVRSTIRTPWIPVSAVSELQFYPSTFTASVYLIIVIKVPFD